MNTIDLRGCTPEPLMGYLKALGIFRLVAEQGADTGTRLSWHGGHARLDTALDRDGLTDFFLNHYRPTPVLSPWNGGSGFYGGGAEPLDAVANSTTARLTLYRETIALIRQFVPKDTPKDEQKQALLSRCRAELPDPAVPWLDTCFVLGEEGPGYFPLLGTGGNDGRLDFTNNFLQRLADVIWFGVPYTPPPDKSIGWLNAALFADSLTPLEKAAVGQFNPGGVGGANGVQGRFEAGSRINPWDFVLMIEGALLFAGSVARRLRAGPSTQTLAFPFCVEGVVVGNGGLSERESRIQGKEPPNGGELWLPLWSQPARFNEVAHLFAEGRAQFGRRQARNSIEFSLAVNLLGISRGIDGFSRCGFLRRNGKAFLATPLGRISVVPRPNAQLLNDPELLTWIDRLREACRENDGKKEKVPGRYKTALRQIDRAMFEFATRSERGNDAKYLLRVLAALGRAERTLATGARFRQEKGLRPLQGLCPQWLRQADDGSPEFRLAAALAGIGRTEDGEVGSLRTHLEEVEFDEKVRRFDWSPGSPSAVWSKQSLTVNLAAVFRRRQMEAFRKGLAGVPLRCYDKKTDTDRPIRPARLDDVVAFLNGETDDDRLADLLWGFVGVDMPTDPEPPGNSGAEIPFEFGVPRLLVEPGCWVADGESWQRSDDGEANAKSDPDVFHLLASGRSDAVDQGVTRAARRLKSGGLLITGYRNRHRAGRPVGVVSAFDANRLLAAMLIPLSRRDLERVANSVLYPPERED